MRYISVKVKMVRKYHDVDREDYSKSSDDHLFENQAPSIAGMSLGILKL